jgi:hypothetical protein
VEGTIQSEDAGEPELLRGEQVLYVEVLIGPFVGVEGGLRAGRYGTDSKDVEGKELLKRDHNVGEDLQ